MNWTMRWVPCGHHAHLQHLGGHMQNGSFTPMAALNGGGAPTGTHLGHLQCLVAPSWLEKCTGCIILSCCLVPKTIVRTLSSGLNWTIHTEFSTRPFHIVQEASGQFQPLKERQRKSNVILRVGPSQQAVTVNLVKGETV